MKKLLNLKNILSTMKLKILIALLILFAFIGFVSAETFTPNNGTFAFREVEVFEINGINFTVPTEYNVTYEDSTEMDFKNGADKLKITVVDNGTIHKVKSNKTKNITSGKTMFGSVEGYLIDKNGTYTFSYKEDGKLITVKSKNMPLMIGAMGKD